MTELEMFSMAINNKLPNALEVEMHNGFISKDYIKSIVLEELGFSPDTDLTIRTRKSELVKARAFCCYFIWELLGGAILTQEKLAKEFGLINKKGSGDHTTVIYYLNVVKDLVFLYPVYSNIFETIKYRLDFDTNLSLKADYIKYSKTKLTTPLTTTTDVKIKRFLRDNGPCSSETVAKVLSCSQTWITRKLNDLYKIGYIKKSERGNYYV